MRSDYAKCRYTESYRLHFMPLSAEQYSQVLDPLRNEKLVYVEFEVKAGNVANIRTSAEPVGEGEGSGLSTA
jgi:hypothetical protein